MPIFALRRGYTNVERLRVKYYLEVEVSASTATPARLAQAGSDGRLCNRQALAKSFMDIFGNLGKTNIE